MFMNYSQNCSQITKIKCSSFYSFMKSIYLDQKSRTDDMRRYEWSCKTIANSKKTLIYNWITQPLYMCEVPRIATAHPVPEKICCKLKRWARLMTNNTYSNVKEKELKVGDIWDMFSLDQGLQHCLTLASNLLFIDNRCLWPTENHSSTIH